MFSNVAYKPTVYKTGLYKKWQGQKIERFIIQPFYTMKIELIGDGSGNYSMF